MSKKSKTTGKEFVALASIKEVGGVPKANDMVRHRIGAHETAARSARSLFGAVNAANCQPTAGLLTQRLEVHEKTAWMLGSLLEERDQPGAQPQGGSEQTHQGLKARAINVARSFSRSTVKNQAPSGVYARL